MRVSVWPGPMRMTYLALLLLLTGFAGPALAAEKDERVWLGLEHPRDGMVEVGPSRLLQVKGWAGSYRQARVDVAIALDISKSTRNGSGVDVDADGEIADLEWRERTSLWSYLFFPYRPGNPADSILAAELEAVRRLVDSLDPARTRVGLVTFWETAQVRSSIGNTRGEFDDALDFISRTLPRGRTNMADAITTATRMLEVAPGGLSPDRELAIILLSDDFPTVPSPEQNARRKAIQAARQAARLGIRIYTFALGVPEHEDDIESVALREVARVSRGEYTPLAQPGDVIDALPRIDLTGLADVQIENRTTGHGARAQGVRADGTFNGFVELAPGENRLRVTARAPSGAEAWQERVVYFEDREPRTPAEREAAAEKLEELTEQIRALKIETDITREIERTRKRRKPPKQVEIDVEE